MSVIICFHLFHNVYSYLCRLSSDSFMDRFASSILILLTKVKILLRI